MTIQAQLTSDAAQSQLVLLLDDDEGVTEGLAAGLEREGRTLITCNDIESAELMVERFQPSHIVADIRMSGPFSYEGLDFIGYARRHAPESRVILMSGDVPEALQLEGSERGAVAFLKKPFEVDELDSILNLISSSRLSPASSDQRHIRVPLIDEILSSGRLQPFVQLIVSLDGSDTPMGYESLARYRSASPLRSPEVLFQYAAKKDRVADLEMACMQATFAIANVLPDTSLLFINVHPDSFKAGSKLADTLIEHSGRKGFPLGRVVLEVTEQNSLPDTKALLATIDRLRELGVRFAFDDVGVAYSHLPLIGKIRPSFLKISQDFGTSFELDPVKIRIISNIVSLANDFNCAVIIEGIEDRTTAQAAADLGISFGQGYLFGRPADPLTIEVATTNWQ